MGKEGKEGSGGSSQQRAHSMMSVIKELAGQKRTDVVQRRLCTRGPRSHIHYQHTKDIGEYAQ